MRALIIATILALASTGSVIAACYEDLGCTDEDVFTRSDLRRLSCSNLWVVRNQIYYEAGYCFKTERALDFFGDDDCSIEDMEDVELSRTEQKNVIAIAAAEKRKGC